MEMRRGEIMAKKKFIQVDPQMATEFKRLRKLEREHSILKQKHELLKKSSDTLCNKKRNLRKTRWELWKPQNNA